MVEKPEDDLIFLSKGQWARVKAALDFYADPAQHKYQSYQVEHGEALLVQPPVLNDKGALARTALEGL